MTATDDGPIETIIEDIESIFPAKAGGIVERARHDRAQRKAAEEAAQQSAEPVNESNYKSVKVTALSPEITATNVVSIAAGATAMILPNNEYRYRATIKATGPLIIAKDSSQALGQVGYPYAATDPPLVIYSRAQLYAYSVGANVVSVLVESYAPNA